MLEQLFRVVTLGFRVWMKSWFVDADLDAEQQKYRNVIAKSPNADELEIRAWQELIEVFEIIKKRRGKMTDAERIELGKKLDVMSVDEFAIFFRDFTKK